jgi:hypothetical protein
VKPSESSQSCAKCRNGELSVDNKAPLSKPFKGNKNEIPKRKNPIIFAAASGLLSMTLGSYAAPENAVKMTNVDINAKPEQYEPEPELNYFYKIFIELP